MLKNVDLRVGILVIKCSSLVVLPNHKISKSSPEKYLTRGKLSTESSKLGPQAEVVIQPKQ